MAHGQSQIVSNLCQLPRCALVVRGVPVRCVGVSAVVHAGCAGRITPSPEHGTTTAPPVWPGRPPRRGLSCHIVATTLSPIWDTVSMVRILFTAMDVTRI
eukprot:620075-Pleurochrysis_carterae.AAC.6